ncbi:MAG: hypothetical protein JO023_22510 [Chloroflexi bacterium]|nr:hypothetical protein [Chloroflexota bacterium]
MLAVVQHQHQAPGLQGFVRQRGELHERHLVLGVSGGLQHQAGLANAGGADQREQTDRPQEVSDLCHFLSPPHEAGQRHRYARQHPFRTHRCGRTHGTDGADQCRVPN